MDQEGILNSISQWLDRCDEAIWCSAMRLRELPFTGESEENAVRIAEIATNLLEKYSSRKARLQEYRRRLDGDEHLPHEKYTGEDAKKYLQYLQTDQERHEAVLRHRGVQMALTMTRTLLGGDHERASQLEEEVRKAEAEVDRLTSQLSGFGEDEEHVANYLKAKYDSQWFDAMRRSHYGLSSKAVEHLNGSDF